MNLKISDVFLDEGYLRVARRLDGHTSKTGKERNVSIEQTILAPIFKEFIEARLKQQKKEKATEAEKSVYVFSTLTRAPKRQRVKSLSGTWSNNRVWQTAYNEARKTVLKIETTTNRQDKTEYEHELKKALSQHAYYWSYGPDEFRHTFGTALAMSGFNKLEICKQMGNSEEVADHHYIAQVSTGKKSRWPLEFGL